MSDQDQIKNSFPKAERLHSRKLIDSLFAKGQQTRNSCLRCVYLLTDEKLESPVQVMFSVPKKRFKNAVTRNLIKRRMREAYRLNKYELNQAVLKAEKNLIIAFLYASDKVEKYEKIEPPIKDILDQLSRLSD